MKLHTDLHSLDLSRRGFLVGALRTLAAAGALGASVRGLAAPPADQTRSSEVINIVSPAPGTAGSVWRPMAQWLGYGDVDGERLNWFESNPGNMQVQLSTGALDVGFSGPLTLSTLRQRGNDIVLFGPGTRNHSVWLVPEDSPYRKPSDLIGKRLATLPETSEVYQQARLAAKLNGLDLKKDFQVIHGPPTISIALLERGDVDGVITLEPTATRLVAAGARQIASIDELWRSGSDATHSPFLVGLSARRSWLESNAETARALSDLFARINQAIGENPEQLRELAAQIGIRADNEAALSLLADRLGGIYEPHWDRTTRDAIDIQVDAAIDAGLLQGPADRQLYHFWQ